MYSLKFNFMKLGYIFKLHKTDICVYLSASVGSEGISLREMVGSRTSWSIFLYLRLGIDLQACNFRMNTFVTLRRRRSIECPWVDFVHRGTWQTLLTDSFPAPGLGVITNQNRFHNCWGKGLFGRYPLSKHSSILEHDKVGPHMTLLQIPGQHSLVEFLRSWVDPESFSPKAYVKMFATKMP